MEDIQEKVALSCRILAMMGLADETRGHVSVRSPYSEGMFIRCRTKNEQGLLFTEADAIQHTTFDGINKNHGDDYIVPNEHPIHGEIYKKRPDVGCVIHVHPPAAVVCSITDIKITPILGAYDPQTIRISLGGVPVYDSSITLTNSKVVLDMIEVMGEKNVCLLRAHGVVVTGKSVEEATIRAIKFERLAQLTLDAVSTGKEVAELSEDEIEYFLQMFSKNKQKKGTSNTHGAWIWKHYVRLLESKGYGLRL